MVADCCLLHIDGFEGQLSSFTKTTLTKFIESRKKWLLVSGPIHDSAVKSLEFISVEEEDVDEKAANE